MCIEETSPLVNGMEMGPGGRWGQKEKSKKKKKKIKNKSNEKYRNETEGRKQKWMHVYGS